MPTNCWRVFWPGAEELDLRLIDFNGGTLRPARVPREAFATLAPLRARQWRSENVSERLRIF